MIRKIQILMVVSCIITTLACQQKSEVAKADDEPKSHEPGHVIDLWPPLVKSDSISKGRSYYGLVVSHTHNDTLLFFNINENGRHIDPLPDTIMFERYVGKKVRYLDGNTYKVAIPIRACDPTTAECK